MEIDAKLDVFEFGQSLFRSSEGISSVDFEQQIKKISSYALDRMEQFSSSVRPSPIEFEEEKNAFLRFLQSLPAGPLSVYAQMQWNEAEKKMDRVDRNPNSTPQERALQKRDIIWKLRAHVGRAVFAEGQFFNEMSAVLKGVNPIKGIEEEFHRAISHLNHLLASFHSLQKRSNLEDPFPSVCLRTSREIALALLTPQGQLNLGIIPDLKAALFPPGHKYLDYELKVSRVLDHMDVSWQPLIDSVIKPNQEAERSIQAIRADLNLPLSVAITDLHAKQAALAALLSCHPRAFTRDGSQFLKDILAQYKELIQYGSIGRWVNGNFDRFFFLNKIGNDKLQQLISVDREGKLENGNFLWDAPNFKFAFMQMGVSSPSANAATALKILGAELESIQTTPDAVIQAFAEASLNTKSKATFSEQILAGRYAFTTTHNHVLHAFETALLGVAEEKRTNYLRGQLVEAVNQVLQPAFHRLQKIFGAGEVAKFRTIFEQTLKDRIRYVYNQAIEGAVPSLKEGVAGSGFELYERGSSDSFQMGTRIETPRQFQQLIVGVADRATRAVTTPATAAVASSVAAIIRNSLFPKQVLLAFDPENRKNLDPVDRYKELMHTPMCYQVSSHFFKVAEIDTGLCGSPNMRINTAFDLLYWILGMAEWKEKIDVSQSSAATFHLRFDMDKIEDYLKSRQKPGEWIEESLFIPGRQISSSIIEPELRKNYIKAITNLLEEEVPQSAARFQKSVAALDDMPMSVSEYMNNVLKVLIQNLPWIDPGQISLVADALLLQTLPQKMRNQIAESAVRVGLMKKEVNSKEMDVCVYFNVRTQTLSFGTIDEDRVTHSLIQILDKF